MLKCLAKHFPEEAVYSIGAMQHLLLHSVFEVLYKLCWDARSVEVSLDRVPSSARYTRTHLCIKKLLITSPIPAAGIAPRPILEL